MICEPLGGWSKSKQHVDDLPSTATKNNHLNPPNPDHQTQLGDVGDP